MSDDDKQREKSVNGSIVPIVIAGSTGSGKSAVAMELARLVDGEIICADSRQVYSHMRIVSAGPSLDDERAVPHVGYHCIDPSLTYDAGKFVDDTDARIADAIAKNRTPILVGGTGMYLRSWRFGLDDVPDKDPILRAQLNEELATKGLSVLFERLQKVDAETAARIGSNDPHRTIRALEVFAVTGQKPSTIRKSFFDVPPRMKARWILLEAPQPWLSQRIFSRARKMFASGLLEEALALQSALGKDHRLVQTMGTHEALQYHHGALALEDAIERCAIRQRQYARRQRIWFRKELWWTRISAEELSEIGAKEAAKTLLPIGADDE